MVLAPVRNNKFWEAKNLSASEGELILYGQIAGERPWWDVDKQTSMIVPIELVADLQMLQSKEKITVHLNSPGGDILAAHAIFTQLKGMPAWIDMIVDGVAASAAIIILMAANRIMAPSNALFLIHKPMVNPNGYVNEDDLEELDKALKTMKASIFEAYAQKLKLSEDEINNLMAAAEWKTAREAQEIGLVDEMLFETVDFAASADKQLLFVNNVPLDISNLTIKPLVPIQKTRQEESPVSAIPTNPTPAEPAKESITNNVSPPPRFENTAQMEAQYPALVAMIRNEAAETERRRIQEIEEISAQIPTELVNQAKYTKPINAHELSFQAMKANAALAGAYTQNAQADAADSMAADVGSVPVMNIQAPQQAQSGLNGMFKEIVAGFERGGLIEG